MDPKTSEQEASYNELLPIYTSTPDKDTLSQTMPVEEAVAEGERVAVLVKQDNEILRTTGIDVQYLDSLVKRVNAFAWSAAVVQVFTDTQTKAAIAWNERKPAGVEARRVLIRSFKYAFRNNPDLLEAVQRIIDGKGNRDLLLDLLSCAKLGKSNIELLSKVNVNLGLLDEAAALSGELSEIFAETIIDPVKYKKAASICNKAWTYLKEALDEIYEAGRFAFDESHERHQLYYSDYYRRLGQSSAKAFEAKKAEAAETAEVGNQLTSA